MISGVVNDTFVTVNDEPTIVEAQSLDVVILKNGDTIVEVFQDAQGFSDGNVLTGVTVEVESERARIIRERFSSVLGSGGIAGASGKTKVIKAPMPGMIKTVFIEVGMTVTQNTSILILEAMKMENSITAGVNGTVRKISIQAGSSIEKGSAICEIEQEG